ncbi:MAG TPA: phosphoribosylanthranilate isomerase [Cyclobacteriaceae bacterium]|nr:phosphoribosylanthranilate isomerase [Cyclobacteriaceae bacterium]
MALKTLVKVGKISNLSDARYCAGMNVDLLGFRVVAGQDHYVSPELFKEIRGWFTGPAIVAEAYGIQKNEDLPAIIQQYLPDYIELSLADLLKLHSPSSTYILSTTFEELTANENTIAPFRNQISKIIIPASTKTEFIAELTRSYKVLLAVENEFSQDLLSNNPNIKGIALQGSPEDKPGLKNYDSISGILEQLEIAD